MFLGTIFVQALLSRNDQYHGIATKFVGLLRSAAGAVVAEAVLLEIADGMWATDRKAASDGINACYRTKNMRVVALETALMQRALQRYGARLDKDWSLTDCVSFVVMRDHGVTVALTTDRHFVQAGFRALLLEEA